MKVLYFCASLLNAEAQKRGDLS